MLKRRQKSKASSSPSKRLSLSNPQFGKYDTLIKYTLVPSIPLSIIAILCINPNTWVLSEIHHFYIELFAVLLAAILSFYYIARAHTLNDKFSLFIGVGFLANAFIDLLHVVVSFTYMNEFMFLKYFIPQTWFAGRIFLGAMFVIAIAGYHLLSGRPSSRSTTTTKSNLLAGHKQETEELPSSTDFDFQRYSQDRRPEIPEEKPEKIPKILVWSLVILSVASGAVAVGSLFIIFPGSVIDNFPLHRPYEVLPLALFVIALLYLYKSDMLPKLFTKFTSKSFSGTGLGLYICKSIVESHGGKIWATNNTDRKGGATFTFTVPLELQTTLSVE